MKVDTNKVVTIDYTLRLNNGEVIDSTGDGNPLAFIYGVGGIIPGLEEGLGGLQVGDEKKISIAPENAYGEFDPEGRFDVPRDQLPADELEVGMELIAAEEGSEGYTPVYVHAILEDHVTLDYNHPLAGETLNFDVTIRDIREASKEELEHGHVHGPHGHHH